MQWCSGVIRPNFFENERGQTVNSERYVAMLQDFFLPYLEENEIDTKIIWFQQDGATAHAARISTDLLRTNFPGRLVSQNGEILWPPRCLKLLPVGVFEIEGLCKQAANISRLTRFN